MASSSCLRIIYIKANLLLWQMRQKKLGFFSNVTHLIWPR